MSDLDNRQTIRGLMIANGGYISDWEIAALTGICVTTVGARRRDLRKKEYGGFDAKEPWLGGHVIHERRSGGTWEYRYEYRKPTPKPETVGVQMELQEACA